MLFVKVENLLIIQFYLIVNFLLDFFYSIFFSFLDLTGCSDGSVYLLNWSHDSSPRQVREPSKRVTKIELTNEGNKVNKRI